MVAIFSVLQVCGVTNHPSYNSRTVDYDFAILTLFDTVTFTVAISPASLPASSSTNYGSRQVK